MTLKVSEENFDSAGPELVSGAWPAKKPLAAQTYFGTCPLIHPNYFYVYGGNSQLYLVNAKPGTNHSTYPTNPNGNSKR